MRLQTYHQNVEAVLSMYEDITIKVCGVVSKQLKNALENSEHGRTV